MEDRVAYKKMDHNYKCVVWWAPGDTISVGGTPDVVDSIPVGAQGSTCMRRGESVSAGQFTYDCTGGVLATPGG